MLSTRKVRRTLLVPDNHHWTRLSVSVWSTRSRVLATRSDSTRRQHPSRGGPLRGLPYSHDGTRLTNIELPIVVGRCGAPLNTLGARRFDGVTVAAFERGRPMAWDHPSPCLRRQRALKRGQLKKSG